MRLAKWKRIRKICFLLCMVMLFVPYLDISCIKIQAAKAEQGSFMMNGKQVKVGKYYYTATLGALYCSQSEGEKGKDITSIRKEGLTVVYNNDAYYTTNYIYYSIYSYPIMSQNASIDIYRMKHDGSKREHLDKISDAYGGKVNLVYKDTFMEFTIEPSFLNSNSSHYYINLKT